MKIKEHKKENGEIELELVLEEDLQEDQMLYAHMSLLAQQRGVSVDTVFNEILQEASKNPELMENLTKQSEPKKEEKKPNITLTDMD